MVCTTREIPRGPFTCDSSTLASIAHGRPQSEPNPLHHATAHNANNIQGFVAHWHLKVGRTCAGPVQGIVGFPPTPGARGRVAPSLRGRARSPRPADVASPSAHHARQQRGHPGLSRRRGYGRRIDSGAWRSSQSVTGCGSGGAQARSPTRAGCHLRSSRHHSVFYKRNPRGSVYSLRTPQTMQAVRSLSTPTTSNMSTSALRSR